MELRHIRYFKAVAEEKNFTRAAEKLAIAQPPLSRQIQDLEEELGTKLFERSPHKVKLTEEGELFLQYASQILDLVNRSEEEVRIRKEGLQGTLYIASVEGCGPHLFAHWISEFQKIHPHVQYILWNGNTDDVNNRVTKSLCEVAMIPKGHPLYSETNEPINPNELLPYDLLIPSRESRQGEIHGWFSDPQSMPIIRGRVAHMMNAYELSKNGVGIAIYPESISSLVRDREVCIRQINHPDAKAFYALIWKKDRTLSHAAEAFIEFIKKNKEGVQ
ncbi:MAG: LysR family transcriptional regulator [Lachnospiraceae bacterium]